MENIALYIMAALYVLAGLNHFRAPQFYQPMMPPWIPKHDLLIVLSGVAEIALGIGLFFENTRVLAAWGVILLLIAVFPANFYMYQARQTIFSSYPQWIIIARLPFQLVLIYWAWIYT